MDDSRESVVFQTSWGWQRLTWRGEKVVSLSLPSSEQPAERSPAKYSVEPPFWIRELINRLRGYFESREVDFSDIEVDTSGATEFDQKVWACLRNVQRGSIVTYGELAKRIGRPGAARAVGNCCARNPVPIIIPCHRVVPAAGGVGGFSGGPEMKRRMLKMEGVYR
ncbi:MAG TPA: methylated-DNA--[protein]-cysteine S-methyltransferase [Firmicutes bacterium]|nr:methylated-DNA--[protein]-cysteine S-methyltransferase [Bacillota bacterium]